MGKWILTGMLINTAFLLLLGYLLQYYLDFVTLDGEQDSAGASHSRLTSNARTCFVLVLLCHLAENNP